MKLIEMVKRLREGEISLGEVIDSKVIPDSVLHYFACNCAERALEEERKAGREPASESWKAIEVKRLWVEGKARDEELANALRAADSTALSSACSEAYREAYSVAATAAYWSSDSVASRAADSVSSRVAYRVTYSSALISAYKKEREWQRDHLIVLMEEYQVSQSSLITVLIQRGKQLKAQDTIVVPSWIDESEEALYVVD